MHDYDRRTAAGDLEVLIKRALGVIRSPWRAVMTKSTSKRTPVGVDSEFWVSIEPPKSRGVSLSPDVRISPSFRFYVTEIQQGPKAGSFYLQATIQFVGKPGRAHQPEWHQSAQSVADRIGLTLTTLGYDRMTY